MKTNKFVLHFSRLALSLFKKMKIGGASAIKISKTYFVLLSACAIFIQENEDRRRLGNKNMQDLFCIALGLRYLYSKK
jgi:hypothetical protein